MLEVRQLRAGYGAINVLWDVSLAFREGELTALVGPNGAGKTTLLKTIVGVLRASAGDVLLDGVSLARRNTWELVEAGVVLIPEGRMIFRDMSVEENLLLGAFPAARRARSAERMEEAYGLFPALAGRRTQLAGSLSGGEAQMLAMARGLMSDPRILLIDEPSLGLAPVIVRELFTLLERIKSAGRTIVLVEQNTALALSVADHVCLMASGRIALDARAAEVDLERLHDLYFAR
jgi:branched-chain amino acid transport system ATP-binding protein